MHRKLFLALLLLISVPALAQRYKRTLRGEVRIASMARQYYYIYYNADGPRLTGTSVTQSPNGDLKATLIGRLSDDGTEMYLRETESLDVMPAGSSLCFFTARLKLTVYPDRRVWSGPFSSREPNGSPCQGGTMTFTDLNPVAPPPPKPQPAARPRPVQTPRPVRPRTPVARTVPQPARDIAPEATPPPVPIVVRDTTPVAEPWPDTTGLKPLYHWRNSTLNFEVWDGVKDDGDVISIRFNGQAILDRTRLTLERRSFAVSSSYNAVDTLTIEMFNEGNLPGNTVKLNLVDGDQRYEIELTGSYSERRKIYFLRRRQW